MCNMYNTNTSRSSCGCGCSSLATAIGNRVLNSLFNTDNGNGCNCCHNCCQNCCNNGSFWNWGCQRICRDCCGNIRVNQCGCNQCWNGCSNGNSTTTTNNGNGNGNSCCAVCSTNGQTLSTLSGDAYYARLYGLNRGSGRSSCGCSCDD